MIKLRKITSTMKSIGMSISFKGAVAFLFILSANGLYAQTFPVDSIFSIIRTNHVEAPNADWNHLAKLTEETLSNATSKQDSIMAVVDIFAELNDVHSTITVDGQTYGFYNPVSDSVYALIAPMLSLSQTQQGVVFDTLLADNIAYLRIPSIMAWGDDAINSYALQVQQTLCTTLDADPDALIIDLRLNTGGNMYPMLAGLWPILGDETVLYTMFPNGEPQFIWFLKKGNLYARDGVQTSFQNQITNVEPACKKANQSIKVYVLVGPLTASSGQATAVALMGRPNTLFIGEPTADGYITANNYYPIGEHIQLNLSSAYIADRNKVAYPRIFLPQVYVLGGDNFLHLSQDLKVQMSKMMFNRKNK